MVVADLPPSARPVDGEYMTLEQAAKLAGYNSSSTLRLAAREGRLRTIRISPRVRLTTREWLEEYLAGVRAGKYGRGQPRSGDAPGEG